MTSASLLARLHQEGFAFDAADGKLRVRPPAGRTLTPEEHEALRQHKAALLAILGGAAVEAGPEWRPRLGESWPAVWNDGRCVRCNGRRWRWSTAAGRWECADPECEAKGRSLWGKGG